MNDKEMAPQKPAHIPDNIFVGYQFRDNTLNGKLAFATAESSTGKIYSEGQFNSWCDKKITRDTFKNEPMNGFYLNKRRKRQSSYGSDAMRVFHPLGFEFEIGMANISYILQYSNVNMSEITSKCILGWIGGKLILIPENSPLFTISYSIKDPTLTKVKSKLTVGAQYITKNAQKCLYLGEHDIYYKHTSELAKENIDAFIKEHHHQINNLNLEYGNYSHDFILKAPIKQPLCYDVVEQEFIYLQKNSLKFLCSEPLATQDQIESLVNDFKKSPYGSPTVVKYESNPEHIFNVLKDAHLNIFSQNSKKKAWHILGIPNLDKPTKNTDVGLYIHTQYMERQITEATNLANSFSYNKIETNQRARTTLPPLDRIFNVAHSFFSYLILFKLYQRKIIENKNSANYDYSAIDLILPEFNNFRIFLTNENQTVKKFSLYPFFDEPPTSKNKKTMKCEIFDLSAIEIFLNDCVDAIQHLVKHSDNVFTEEVCIIIAEQISQFFDKQKEKLMLNIDRNLKAIVIENETQSYQYILTTD